MELFLFSIVALIVLTTSSAFVNSNGSRARGAQRLQQHNGTRPQFSQSQPSGVGLLRGIDVVSADYYSQSLAIDSIDDVEWLLTPGLLWEAATKDAQDRNMTTEDYLKDMYDAMDKFTVSGEVHDREEFYQFLNGVYANTGKLLLVLGGKSVGKSLVLADFEKKLQEKRNYYPLLVDARTFSGASLATGILEGYKKIPEVEAKNIGIKAYKFLSKLFQTNTTRRFMEGLGEPQDDKAELVDVFIEAIDMFIKTDPSAPQTLRSFVQLAEALKRKPVLIIDEANKVLGLGEGQNASSSTLDQIVQLTKQSSKMKVIMASSEFGYPYLLERNGLNLNDISKILFAGEIPPWSMWDLLVTKKVEKKKP